MYILGSIRRNEGNVSQKLRAAVERVQAFYCVRESSVVRRDWELYNLLAICE